ncbi:DUF4345 domain-containing protein [Roseobacteraceae bacterium S113]
MSLFIIEKAALGASGLTALGIGVVILSAPKAFFAGYGITIGDDPSLLSELRAPAAGLAAFGVLMLIGLWRKAVAPLSKTIALTVFLAFPAGRVIGLAIDGVPSAPILGALAFEIMIGCLCIFAFVPWSKPRWMQLDNTPVEY